MKLELDEAGGSEEERFGAEVSQHFMQSFKRQAHDLVLEERRRGTLP